MAVELPSSDSRTVIVGATGSGKTQFSVWLLSTRDWHKRIWFILDFKGDKLINALDLPLWNFGDEWPNEPGLYLIRILPGQEDLVSQFFLTCYNAGNVGIYIDEMYQLPYQDRWIRACLTQGRSKNIEIIGCTQRPVRIDVFFLSEASYIGLFNLRVKDDRKRMSDYMDGLEINRLPKYHCLWYDVGDNESVVFEPVPDAATLIEIFHEEIEAQETEQENESRIIAL